MSGFLPKMPLNQPNNLNSLHSCRLVTELAREQQPLDGSLTSTKSNDASAVESSAGSSAVLPSPDVLTSLDMIHNWLQQSEQQADTDSQVTTSISFCL